MRKFVFMFVVFILSVGIVNNAFGSSEKKNTAIYYEEVCISKGESYWDIAGKYKSDGLTRKEYTEYIMEFNGAVDNKILAGQKIVVPVIKYI